MSTGSITSAVVLILHRRSIFPARYERIRPDLEGTRGRAIQKVTEQKLQDFIDSLRRGGNGHSQRPLR
jgi:hypothetical protein